MLELARGCNISHTTAYKYINLLENQKGGRLVAPSFVIKVSLNFRWHIDAVH